MSESQRIVPDSMRIFDGKANGTGAEIPLATTADSLKEN